MSAVSTPAEGLELSAAVEAAVEEWRRRSEGTPDERASISWPRDRTRILVEVAAPFIAKQAAAKALRDAADALRAESDSEGYGYADWLDDRAQGIEGRDAT